MITLTAGGKNRNNFVKRIPTEVKTESEYLQEVHAAMELLKQNTLRRAKSKVKYHILLQQPIDLRA